MSTQTDPRYWDCECSTHYQHLKLRVTQCQKCGAVEDEQPDSIVEELKRDVEGYTVAK